MSPKKVENLLVELVGLKEKQADNNEMLKSYKIKSEKLTQLKRVKKDLMEQISEEKKEIEDKFFEDEDYEKASNAKLTLLNQIREKNAEIREALANMNPGESFFTVDYNVKGEQMKLQIQRVPKFYLNGKEQK